MTNLAAALRCNYVKELKIDDSFWMTNRWLFLNFDALGALSVLIALLFSISTLMNEAGHAGLYHECNGIYKFR